MTTHYLEDLSVGQKFDTDRQKVDAARIKSFAAQFDPQPFHLDEDAAEKSLFGGLAASGWHTAAMTMRLLVDGEFKPAAGILGAGFDQLQWPRAARRGVSVPRPGCRCLAPFCVSLVHYRREHDSRRGSGLQRALDLVFEVFGVTETGRRAPIARGRAEREALSLSAMMKLLGRHHRRH